MTGWHVSVREDHSLRLTLDPVTFRAVIPDQVAMGELCEVGHIIGHMEAKVGPGVDDLMDHFIDGDSSGCGRGLWCRITL